jgi:cyclic-di-GMP phosphodiesterase TipF (flagellum assembly factor)
MPLDKNQRSMALAGTLISVSTVTALFVFSPGLAIVMGGLFALTGFFLYDRVLRRLWEHSVTQKLEIIENSNRALSQDVRQTAQDLGAMREQIKEQAKARAAKRGRAGAAYTLGPLTPQNRPPVVNDINERRFMDDLSDQPLALRAADTQSGTQAIRYEELANEPEISDTAVKQLMNEALRSQRIDVFLQPIMKLPQRKVRFYEMYARVRARPGVYLSAQRYMKLADSPMIREIDLMLLDQCLEMLRATATLDRAAPFFINVTQGSLKNNAFMKKLLAFLATHRDLAGRMVFEIKQEDYRTLDVSVSEVMKALSKLGCSFSVDNVRTMEFDVTNLQRHNIRYIKIPARNFFPAIRSARDLADLTRLKRKLEGNSIAVIVEKIEDEAMLRELSDFDISYGQGFLFGRPDLQGAYQNKQERVRRSS